jgi:TolB-like protein/Flp pilus assembly protein TadD
VSDKPTDVFISYSREDQDQVFELATRLRSAGVGLWIDQGSLDAAAQWGQQIVEALDAAKVMLLMISPAAVRSDNVAKEVTLISERRGTILPLHLEQTTIPPSLKYPLAGIQHIELYNGDPEEKLQAVLRSLARLGVNLAPPERAVTAGSARPAAEPATAAAASAESTTGALAILPFENLSADPEADYFSDGLTDELFSRLSAISGIELISRWSSMQYKGQKLDPRTIGAQLGARHLVGGSVRKHLDSVRVSVQLVDVATNRQIWGSTFKGELANIFEIQEQVSQQIVEALKLKLSFSEKVSLTKRSTVNAQAFDLYLRGQELLYRLTRKSVEHAIQLFEKAIELDPRYAAAYASAASAFGIRYQWFDRDSHHREKAQEFSFKALMYDPNLAEAYSAMGLSYFLWGKFEESSAACKKAMELDPEDFVVYWTLGRIHFSKGELAPAAELFRKLTRMKPDFYAGFGDLAQTCDGLGLVEEAGKARAQLLEMMPMHLLRNPDDARGRLFYAIALSRIGKREQALAEGLKTVEGSSGDCLILYNLACFFSEMGERQKALETLRAAVQSGYQDFGWMQNDPDLTSLRDEPAFQELKKFAHGDVAAPI